MDSDYVAADARARREIHRRLARAGWLVQGESLDRLESATRIAAARAESLRRSLLDAAFSGRLVPQDPADEPAAELLARVAAQRPTSPRKRTSSRSASQ